MADRRLVSTKRWKEKWFRELGSALRDVRQFIADEASNAGFWEIDLDTLKHFTGQKVTLEQINKCFQGPVYVMGDCLFIPELPHEWNGQLSEDCRPHKAVIKELHEKGAYELYQKYLDTLSKGYAKGYQTLLYIYNTETNTEGGAGETNPTVAPTASSPPPPVNTFSSADPDAKENKTQVDEEFERAWQLYPNKIERAEGFRRLRGQMATLADAQRFTKAVQNYARYCRLEWMDWYSPKQFDVFAGAKSAEVKPWIEWVNPDPSVYKNQKKTKNTGLKDIKVPRPPDSTNHTPGQYGEQFENPISQLTGATDIVEALAIARAKSEVPA